VRWFLVMALGSNIFFQVISTSVAEDLSQIIIVWVYWIATLITIILLALSLKRDKYIMVYLAFIVHAVRNILRLYNFEGTDEKVLVFFMQQVYAFCLLLGLYQFFPEGLKQSYPVSGLKMLWVIAEVRMTGSLDFSSVGKAIVAVIIITIFYLTMSKGLQVHSSIIVELFS
jgi:hypothetical protein